MSWVRAPSATPIKSSFLAIIFDKWEYKKPNWEFEFSNRLFLLGCSKHLPVHDFAAVVNPCRCAGVGVNLGQGAELGLELGDVAAAKIVEREIHVELTGQVRYDSEMP